MAGQKPWEPSWIVTEKLGRGGQGETDLVENSQTKEKAVLKTLVRPNDAKARGRMHIEVESLKTLRKTGANVPAVLDGNTGSEEEALYFVMEYIEGQTLTDFVAEGHPLSAEMATNIVASMSSSVPSNVDSKISSTSRPRRSTAIVSR